jgi:Na+-transporting NADH:ubiquinone oxidoreductase subunit C
MSRDSVGGTFAVAAVLCIVCSLLVSSAAVVLRPLQNANRAAYEKENILLAAGKADEEAFKFVIELGTANLHAEGTVVAANYNQRSAAKNPDQSVEINSANDIAGIKRREKYGRVYAFRDANNKVTHLVLPVYGKGLWSTLYGFLAIQADGKTSTGLTFYDHKETPGLGGEIESEKFKASWRPDRNLQLFDEDGNVIIEVTKGAAIQPSHQVDGISGATITSRGVSNLVRYWLSDEGYGPVLEILRAGDGQLEQKLMALKVGSDG